MGKTKKEVIYYPLILFYLLGRIGEFAVHTMSAGGLKNRLFCSRVGVFSWHVSIFKDIFLEALLYLCVYIVYEIPLIYIWLRTERRRISFASDISIWFLDFTVNQLRSTHITGGRMTAIKNARLACKQTGWHFFLADWGSIMLLYHLWRWWCLPSKDFTIICRRGHNLSGGGACSILVSRLRMQHHPAWHTVLESEQGSQYHEKSRVDRQSSH